MRPSLPGVDTTLIANVVRDVLAQDKPKLPANADHDIITAGKLVTDNIRLADGTRQPRVFTRPISQGPPPKPQDGDIWIATGVDANGTRWTFQYNVRSTSTYRWEFVGGSALVASGNPGNVINGLSQIGALGWYYWAGTQLTLVRAGEYDVRSAVQFAYNGGGGASGMQLTTGFTNPNNVGDSTGNSQGYVDATDQWRHLTHEALVTVSASQAVMPAYNGLATNVIAVGPQFIAITPRRIT